MREIEIKDKLSNTLVIDIKLSNKINIIDGNRNTIMQTSKASC